MVRSSSGGTSSFQVEGGETGASERTAASVAASESRAKSRRPAQSSQSTTPSEKTSARASTRSPRACSGAMYATLPFSVPGSVRPARSDRARDAEVGELHLALERDEDVVGGDVAVHEPERAGHASESRCACASPRATSAATWTARGTPKRHAQLARPLGDAAEVAAAHELHRDVVAAVDLVELEHLDDVGVAEARGEPRLLDEHPDEVAPRGVLAADELQRDLLHDALGAGHLGAPDVGHAARGEGLDEPVLAEGAHRPWIVGPPAGARKERVFAGTRRGPEGAARRAVPRVPPCGAASGAPAPPQAEQPGRDERREREERAAREATREAAPGPLPALAGLDEDGARARGARGEGGGGTRSP